MHDDLEGVADLVRLIGGEGPAWTGVLQGASAAALRWRPAPDVWTGLEYAAHVRRVKPDAYTVGEVWDSTDRESWRNRTALLLEVLFPASRTEQPPAELSRWLTDPR